MKNLISVCGNGLINIIGGIYGLGTILHFFLYSHSNIIEYGFGYYICLGSMISALKAAIWPVFYLLYAVLHYFSV